MKFKAKLVNANLIVKMLQAMTIEKGSGTTIVHIEPESFGLIITPQMGDGVAVFSEVQMGAVFSEIRCESKNNNHIMFECQTKNLLRALKTSTSSSDVTVKLTRDKAASVPYLTFLVNNAIPSAHMTSVTQEVPIEIYSAQQFASVREPSLADPEVSIELPALREVQHVVERMKAVGQQVHVSASAAGDLALKVDTELVFLSTYYKNLPVPSAAATLGAGEEATATVEIKKLQRALGTWQCGPKRAICCIVSQPPRALVLYNVLEAGTLTWYLPWLSDD
eukprot:tig00021123_g18492.t1